VSGIIIPRANDELYIYPQDGGSIIVNDSAGNDVIYVRGIKITELGTIFDLKAENFNGAAGKLVDVSTNDLDATNNGATFIGGTRHLTANSLNLSGLPTSATGLSAGEVYSNTGVLTVVT